MRKFFTVTLKIFLGMMVALVISGGLIAWRLHYAPINITAFKSYIQQHLPDVAFEELKLSWPLFYKDPQIFIEKPVLTADAMQVHAERALVDIDALSLLFGDVVIQHFVLVGPEIDLDFPEQNAQQVGVGFPTDLVLKHLYEHVQNAGAELGKIAKTIEYMQGKILVKRGGETLFTVANLSGLVHASEESLIAKMSGKFQMESAETGFFIEIGTTPGVLTAHFNFTKLPLLSHLKKFSVPTESYENLKDLLSGDITVSFEHSKEGVDAKMKGRLLYDLKQGVETIPIGVNIGANLNWGSDSLAYDVSGGADAVDLKYAPVLWPKKLAYLTRTWFVHHMTRGQAIDAHVNLKGNVSYSAQESKPAQVTGHMKLRNVKLLYIEGMPEVLDLDGDTAFNNQSFNINVLKGHLRDIKIQDGFIQLMGLNVEDQIADIALKIKGPASQVLWLIDHKPLEYAKAFGFDPEQITGGAFLNLSLKFPMRTTLSVNQLVTDITADLDSLALQQDIVSVPTYFTEGAVKISLNNERLHLGGECKVQGVPATITWEEAFKEGAPFKSKYLLNFTPPAKTLFPYGLSFAEGNMQGPLKLQLTYVKLADKTDHLTLVGNLDDTILTIPLLGWEKKKGVKAVLQASLHMQDNHLKEISNVTFEAPADTVQGQMSFDKGVLTRAALKSMILGKTNLHGTIEQEKNNSWQVHLKGLSLDLHQYLHGPSQSEPPAESSALPDDFVFLGAVDNIILDHDVNLAKFNVSMKRAGGKWRYISAESLMHKQDKFTLSYKPEGADQLLYFETNNMGAMLRGADISEDIYGGEVKVYGSYPLATPDEPLKGRIKISKLRTKNAPVLAQLLTLASISGIQNLLKGHGVVFDTGRGKFDARDGIIVLNDFSLSNGSIGLTADGVVDMNKKWVHFTGNVIPAFMLNQLLGHIPLIGTVLSGGEPSKGVFSMSYEVKGPFAKPEVLINPFSVLAPNLLKNFFDDKTSLQKIEEALATEKKEAKAAPVL